MTKMLLKFVQEFRDRHGKTRRYVRRPGFKSVPLPGDPGSPEFMAAYQAAISPDTAQRIQVGASKAKAGTVHDLVARYYRSAEFTGLRASTQSTYRSIIEPWRAKNGDKRVATLHRQYIKDTLVKRAATPTAANNWLKRMRQLMAVAIDEGMRTDDPTANVKPLRITSGGHPMWTADHIEAFRRRHPQGSQARLAMELALNTMQGRSDLVRLGRPHLQAGLLSIRRLKTNAAAEIPILPELQVELDRLPAAQGTFLMTAYGKRFTANGFGNKFRDWCDEAGLPKRYNSHGLRKAGATRGAEAGWTDHEIMAWGGWTSLSEVQRYTKAANRRKLARSAVHKLGKV